MSTSKAKPLELEMLAKGYASARIAAWKLRKQFGSVLRQIDRGQFRGIKVGYHRFVEIQSIKEYLGPDASRALDLDNWEECFDTSNDGHLYVKIRD